MRASIYRKAVAARPAADRRRLVAAEIMRAVYSETLGRIERGGYDVFAIARPRAEAAAGRDCASTVAVSAVTG